ncbi:MAG: hypothetical protein QXY40_01415 [Candidatus Methanomethylicia archaeon]
MEKIIQYIKDRTKLFDNYIPLKDKRDNEYVSILMKSTVYIKQTWINKKIKLRINRSTIPK